MRRVSLFCAALPLTLQACSGSEANDREIDAVGAAVIDTDTTKETNTIHGNLTLTTSNPTILGLLNTNLVSWGALVRAGSLSGLYAEVWPPAPTPPSLTLSYELTAESSATGVAYNVDATRGIWFPAQSVLLDNTLGGVTVNFTEAVGLAELHFTCNGGPEFFPAPADVNVDSNPTGRFYDTASKLWYIMLRDGQVQPYTVDVMTGSSWSLDRIQYRKTGTVTGIMDVIQPVALDFACGDPNAPLGELHGQYDVLGETEQLSVYTIISGRPDGNYRDFSATVPSPFVPGTTNYTLPNLLPDALWTSLGLNGFIREGYEFTYFQATRVNPGPIAVGPQSLTPEPFVMTPAFYRGTLDFYNPELPLPLPTPGSLWSWKSLSRVASGATGIPSDPYPQNQSSIMASAADGGFAATSFAGTFNPATHRFTTTYELPLLTGWNTTGTWSPTLRLTFLDSTTTDTTQYRWGSLDMTVAETAGGRAIPPGAAETVDYAACFNEVVMDLYVVGSATALSDPTVGIDGGFAGHDENLNRPLDYHVTGGFHGLTNTPPTSGTVSFPLPRGEYTLAPSANVTSGGVTSRANFSSYLLNASCGQFLYIRDLAVSVDWADTCVSAPETAADAVVDVSLAAGAQLDRVWYTVNGGAEVELCNGNCVVGALPALSVPAADLSPGSNTVDVFAATALQPALPGHTVTTIKYDPTGTNPTCEPIVDPEPTAACVVGTNSVDVRDNSRVEATVSTGRLDLQADARLTQGAEAERVTLAPRATILGELTYETSLSQDPTASVETATLGPVTVPAVPTRGVPAGTTACSLEPGTVATFPIPTATAPVNCYSTVLKARSTVTFGPGTYSFDSLTIEPDVTIVLNGDVTFLVSGNARFESRVNYVLATGGSFLVYAGGNIDVQPAVSAFPGSLQAPNGTVHVYSNVSLHGCIAAQNIIIEPSSQVIGEGSVITPPAPSCVDGVQNGDETDIDCGGGTCPACPTCTDGIVNGTEIDVDCGGSCPACATCTDGVQNGAETGIDCGGSCPACATCTDGVQNGAETGVDCGGSCAPCASPCAGLCSNPVASSAYYFPLWNTANATCFEMVGQSFSGGICGNAPSGRTLSINGQTMTCNWQVFTPPALRNGGYCIQENAGSSTGWGGLSRW